MYNNYYISHTDNVNTVLYQLKLDSRVRLFQAILDTFLRELVAKLVASA